MQKKELNVKNTEELQKHWDSFSLAYSEKVSPNTASLYLSMLTMLEVEKSDSILECAVGSGYLTPYLIQKKNPNAKLYLTDLSTPFLSMTQKRIELFESNKQNEIFTFDLSNLPKFDKPVQFQQYNTTLQQANSENLEDFPENSIQSYISSLCLQLTTDPVKMIQETFRVLKPGGKACFSVWGSKEKTLQLSMLPKILMKNGVQLPNDRSNFHLNDREKLIEMFKKEGFTQPLCWPQFIPFNQITNEKDMEEFFQFPQTKNMINLAPEEKRESIKQQIKEAYLEVINEQQQAIGLEALVIMVTKPEQ